MSTKTGLDGMDAFTEITKRWLDRRYRQVDDRGVYHAHEPIYGIGGYSEQGHARRYVRLFQILREVRAIGGSSLLDVGGSEGFLSFACRELFAMQAVSVDLSAEAGRRARELFSLPVLALDSAVLPFEDGAFDVVTLTEVIEHLARPIHTLGECQRVARRGLVVSTEEWCSSAEDRARALEERVERDHMERNILCSTDLPALFAPHQVACREQWLPPEGMAGFVEDRDLDADTVSAYLRRCQSEPGLPGGIVLNVSKDSSETHHDFPDDEAIIDFLIAHRLESHCPSDLPPGVPWPRHIAVHCPDCRQTMDSIGGGFRCTHCPRSFAPDRGVVSVFPTHTRSLEEAAEELSAQSPVPNRQAYLVELDRSWEIERPSRLSWTTPSELSEWETSDQVHALGEGRFEMRGEDPRMLSPRVSLDLSRLRRVVVRMAVDSSSSQEANCAELFWWLDGELGFTQEASQPFLLRRDGRFHDYVLEPPKSWSPGERYLVQLRFDPTNGPGIVTLESIRVEVEG